MKFSSFCTHWTAVFVLVLVVSGCSSAPERVRTTPTESVVREASSPQALPLRIATFNIRDFGKTKIEKQDIVAILAEIVRSYDVVAVQEISDISGQVPLKFLQAINATGNTYGLILSQRSGEQTDDLGGAEQYAFYYNTKTVSAQNQGALYPDGASDDFQREPFVAGFETVKGGVRFVLITIHTAPEKARTEIPALAKSLAWARARFLRQDGFVLLGDFNASGTYASAVNLDRWRGNELPYLWVVPDDADTNVSTTSVRAYDRIVATDGMATRFTSRWGVDRSFTDGAVSDHWPVWAEFDLSKNR